MIHLSKMSAVLTFLTFSASTLADEWPQWRGPQRDGVWRETGLVEKFETPELKLRWSVPLGGGYSGPTVADGRVYVSDRVTEPKELERVHCFEWKTGKEIWSHSYEAPYGKVEYRAGPRASVHIDNGHAYSLGSLGHLYCFAATDGTVRWKKDLNAQYKIRMPIWGISAAPVIEKDLVIVQIGGEEACMVAFDKKTGEERWKALADNASYSAPIVIDQAGKRVLVCWTADSISGLDPASGKVHWTYPYPSDKWAIAISTPVLYKDLLLFSEAHKGTLLLRLHSDKLAVEKVWHHRNREDKDDGALHCLQSTPYIADGFVYGVDSDGVLRCLELKTGKPRWDDGTLAPKARWSSMHLVPSSNQVWMFNERGELIIAKPSADGPGVVSKAKLLVPTEEQLPRRGGVTWSHPAFAYRHVFARNDKELVCADLSAP